MEIEQTEPLAHIVVCVKFVNTITYRKLKKLVKICNYTVLKPNIILDLVDNCLSCFKIDSNQFENLGFYIKISTSKIPRNGLLNPLSKTAFSDKI